MLQVISNYEKRVEFWKEGLKLFVERQKKLAFGDKLKKLKKFVKNGHNFQFFSQYFERNILTAGAMEGQNSGVSVGIVG